MFCLRPSCKITCDFVMRGGGGLVGRDLAWGLEGGSSPATDHNMESGLVAEEVPIHFLGYCRGALEQGTKPPCAPRALTWQPTAPSLQCVCVCVCTCTYNVQLVMCVCLHVACTI